MAKRVNKEKVIATETPATEVVATEVVATEATVTEAPATETPATETKSAIVLQMEETLAAIKSNVEKYNEHVKFAEYKAMTTVRATLDGLVSEYAKLSESECFSRLKKCADPMLEAAKILRYDVVKLKEDSEDHELSVEDSTKVIDPLRLHKAVVGGIGADKLWYCKVEQLNLLFTVYYAKKFGIDPKKVSDAYAISDEARKINAFNGVTSAEENYLAKCVAETVHAMIGDDFEVSSAAVAYLHGVYLRKNNRKSLAVTAANHKYMRQYAFEICHEAITKCGIELEYKTKK